MIRNYEILYDFSVHECVVDEGEFQHYAFISNFRVKNIEETNKLTCGAWD